jgi:hypothetical protein
LEQEFLGAGFRIIAGSARWQDCASLEFNAIVNLHFQSKQQNTIMATVRLFYYGEEIRVDEMAWARGI